MTEDLRRGKEKAYHELFRTFYRPLVAFAFEYVGDLDTARDLVQALFVHLWENRARLEVKSSLRSYLYRAVRNRCLNHLKQRDRLSFSLEKAGQDLPAEGPDLEQEMDRKELEHRIFRVVESLPPRCRDIFLLSRVKQLDNGEIARQLRISKRTVETQISKALKVLREKIS